MTSNYIGIDGCRSGWVIAKASAKQVSIYLAPTLNNRFKSTDVIVIDMPVILPKSIEEYPRQSDKAAKKILKRYHGSIFYAPLATWLAMDYMAINDICFENQKPKLSKQSFNLFERIKDVQTFLTQNLININESHPELFFRHYDFHLASKKTTIGQNVRRQILDDAIEKYQIKIPWHDFKYFQKSKASLLKWDDVLDALAMMVVAIKMHKAHDFLLKNHLIF